MSLYIQLHNSFWHNRKTIKLQRVLGETALWLPPRLWCYAALHQPDGDFSQYEPVDLAEAIGFKGDPVLMVEGLQGSGFMDGMKLHGWEKHNAFHASTSHRAKHAAEARWTKEKNQKKTVQIKNKNRIRNKSEHDAEMLKHDPHDAPSIEEIYNAYPLKVAKPDALRAIEKALQKTDAIFLLEKTKQYALIRSGDLTFVPHPATWFNQKRYDDDPSTWEPHEQSNGNGSHSTRPRLPYHEREAKINRLNERKADIVRRFGDMADTTSEYQSIQKQLKEL